MAPANPSPPSVRPARQSGTAPAALGVLLLVLSLSLAGPAAAQRVPLHQVPAPVMDAVRARFAGVRLSGAAREFEGGRVVYEVTLRRDGRTIDVTLTPEGAIVLIEREIDARDLPAPVRETLESRYPGARYQDVEEVTRVDGPRETLDHYAVELVTAQRTTLDVRLSPGGRLLR